MVKITFFARLHLVLIKLVLERREEKMVLREIEFECHNVSIASELFDELCHIKLVAPGCGYQKSDTLSQLETQYFCVVELGETAVMWLSQIVTTQFLLRQLRNVKTSFC